MAAGRNPSNRYELGRDIYNYRCYFCHGYGGDAKTLASTYLSPQPRDFTAADSKRLTRAHMVKAVAEGRSGSAMMGFNTVLKEDEIGAVVDFIRQEFMQGKPLNTRYHTPENGWPNHERYAAAFPFAQGNIALDMPDDKLTTAQKQGKRLFLASCITCHDHGRVNKGGPIWDQQSISYPRGGYSHKQQPTVDAISSASPFAKHDQKPTVKGLTQQEQLGERLFQSNCAFCHAADGTGHNWIGSFLQPHPRDLVNSEAMQKMTRSRLKQVILDGLPGTTMPAWKSVLTIAQIEAIIAYIDRAFRPLADDTKR